MYLAYLAVLVLPAATARQLQLTDEEIDDLNSRQTAWRAGRNFPLDTPDEYLRVISNGVKPNNPSNLYHINTVVHDQELIDSLPETFDPTTKWPNCPSLKEIREQAYCGSCWAFGAVSAMTDRWCIYSNSSLQFRFSSDDLTTCAGETTLCFGCNGGYPPNAWQYWVTDGIVSGGQYGSGEGCRPYEIHPGYRPDPYLTPPCKKQCVDSYRSSYSKDKRYGKSFYRVPHDEDQIRAEIFKNGPVETSFIVYMDFGYYHSGVYIHDVKFDTITGLHAVKIIGWGVENGTKYWHVANSWGTNWGKLGGFFKILRGENHCDFESDIWAGEPLLL